MTSWPVRTQPGAAYRLRPMRQEDIDAIIPLERQLFAGDPPWSEAQFRSELNGVPDTRWYLVAELEGELAGYAGVAFGIDTAEIETLAVAPAHQRRGLGERMLQALIAEAVRRGARELLLEARADNAAALALYAKHGFERIAVRRGYYGAGRYDGVVLRRRLTREGP